MMQADNNKRGVILEVPYSEKDMAKALGARWDPDLRKWFVPNGLDEKRFERWSQKKSTSKPD